LEGTLKALQEAGSISPLKSSRARTDCPKWKVFSVKAYDFDNLSSATIIRERQGDDGCRNRVSIDLDHLTDQTPRMMVAYDRMESSMFRLPFGMESFLTAQVFENV